MQWWRANDLPKDHEGKLGWWYDEKTRVQSMKEIPLDYSRDPKHCKGLWVTPVIVPAPPPAK